MGSRTKLAAIATFIAASPAWAFSVQDTPQAQSTHQAAESTTADAAQPTEKEAKGLERCKKMTPQHRAQSSKCADLMKKFGIEERERNHMSESLAR